MSADNYLYVRLRDDGKFGVSHRFASTYYADDGQHDCPDEWLSPAPKDRLGIFTTADEAIKAAHHEYAHMAIVEYGVCIAPEVLKDWIAA